MIKILLADDSVTIQKVIGIIFGSEEYALTVVDNGKAAVDKAREISPDILLIDAIMPGMSGYEVCEAIRSIPALATKPLLLLTGSFEPFDETKANICGADDFLAKPFESQQIIDKVKSLYELGVSRAAAVQPEPAWEQPEVIPQVISSVTSVGSEPAPKSDIEDIWSAFTSAPEPAVTVPQPSGLATGPGPETFTVINEKPDTRISQPQTPPATDNNIGSKWIPVEEHSFEFTDEPLDELPDSALNGKDMPVFDAPTVSSTESLPINISRPIEAGSPAVLTEEQLKAAISTVSQEIIQKIVWEVVPGLAETLIKDAIRKIKEGA